MGNVIKREIGYEIDDEIDAPVVPIDFDNEKKIEKEEIVIEHNNMIKSLENENEFEEEEEPKYKSKPPITIEKEEIEEEEKEDQIEDQKEEKEDQKDSFIFSDNQIEHPNVDDRNKGNNRYSRIFLEAYKKRNDKVEIREDENVKEDFFSFFPFSSRFSSLISSSSSFLGGFDFPRLFSHR